MGILMDCIVVILVVLLMIWEPLDLLIRIILGGM